MMAWRKYLLSKSANLIDGWSVPHFLFGSVMAMIALVLEHSFLVAFVTTIIIAIIWEYVEVRIIGIKETRANMIVDVVLPLVAFWITFTLVSQATIDHEHRVALLIITLLMYTFTNIMAWRARFNHDHEFMG